MSELGEIKRYYDTVYYGEPAHALAISRHLVRLARKMNLQPGDRILDVACGKGEWLIALQDHGVFPVGVDLSSAAIKVCRSNLSTGVLAVATAESLPFPDNSFDFISCLGAIEHLIDPLEALREIVRVSRPGARFLLLVPNEDFFLRRWRLYGGTRQADVKEMVRRLGEWTQLFQEAGLEVDARWKDLHVLSKAWINQGTFAMRPARALVALSLALVPLACQYQVYHLCRVASSIPENRYDQRP